MHDMSMHGASHGATSAAAMASFVGMWAVMTAAMMLPSLVPALRHHRPTLGIVTAAGYLTVWTVLGVAVWPLSLALAHPASVVVGVVVLLAGALQLGAWRTRHLTAWRVGRAPLTTVRAAWRRGLHLGGHCVVACAGLTAIMLVVGTMDVRALLAMTAVVTAERLAPRGDRIARAVGAIAVATGVVMVLRA